MIIVIDGYNLLKQVFPRIKNQLEKQRQQLIHQLGYYKTQKAKTIKEIVLVFDAGPFGHATREIRSGIVIIFSGQNSCADTWIIDYIERSKSKEILLITRDRKIIESCKQSNVHSMGVFEFYDIVKNCFLEEIEQQFPTENNNGNIQKYKQIESNTPQNINNKALDLLMEEASLEISKDKDDEDLPNLKRRKKAGKTHTLSKKEKRRYSKIKKLF